MPSLGQMLEEIKEALDDGDEKKQPVRSVKMSKEILAEVEKSDKWAEPKAKRAKEIIDELQEILRDKVERNELLWSKVQLDMGLSSSRYKMRVNREDGAIDITEDRWVD